MVSIIDGYVKNLNARSRHKKQSQRNATNIFFVKSIGETSAGIRISKSIVYCPGNWIGKRLRLKVELLNEKNMIVKIKDGK